MASVEALNGHPVATLIPEKEQALQVPEALKVDDVSSVSKPEDVNDKDQAVTGVDASKDKAGGIDVLASTDPKMNGRAEATGQETEETTTNSAIEEVTSEVAKDEDKEVDVALEDSAAAEETSKATEEPVQDEDSADKKQSTDSATAVEEQIVEDTSTSEQLTNDAAITDTHLETAEVSQEPSRDSDVAHNTPDVASNSHTTPVDAIVSNDAAHEDTSDAVVPAAASLEQPIAVKEKPEPASSKIADAKVEDDAAENAEANKTDGEEVAAPEPEVLDGIPAAPDTVLEAGQKEGTNAEVTSGTATGEPVEAEISTEAVGAEGEKEEEATPADVFPPVVDAVAAEEVKVDEEQNVEGEETTDAIPEKVVDAIPAAPDTTTTEAKSEAQQEVVEAPTESVKPPTSGAEVDEIQISKEEESVAKQPEAEKVVDVIPGAPDTVTVEPQQEAVEAPTEPVAITEPPASEVEVDESQVSKEEEEPVTEQPETEKVVDAIPAAPDTVVVEPEVEEIVEETKTNEPVVTATEESTTPETTSKEPETREVKVIEEAAPESSTTTEEHEVVVADSSGPAVDSTAEAPVSDAMEEAIAAPIDAEDKAPEEPALDAHVEEEPVQAVEEKIIESEVAPVEADEVKEEAAEAVVNVDAVEAKEEPALDIPSTAGDEKADKVVQADPIEVKEEVAALTNEEPDNTVHAEETDRTTSLVEETPEPVDAKEETATTNVEPESLVHIEAKEPTALVEETSEPVKEETPIETTSAENKDEEEMTESTEVQEQAARTNDEAEEPVHAVEDQNVLAEETPVSNAQEDAEVATEVKDSTPSVDEEAVNAEQVENTMEEEQADASAEVTIEAKTKPAEPAGTEETPAPETITSDEDTALDTTPAALDAVVHEETVPDVKVEATPEPIVEATPEQVEHVLAAAPVTEVTEIEETAATEQSEQAPATQDVEPLSIVESEIPPEDSTQDVVQAVESLQDVDVPETPASDAVPVEHEAQEVSQSVAPSEPVQEVSESLPAGEPVSAKEEDEEDQDEHHTHVDEDTTAPHTPAEPALEGEKQLAISEVAPSQPDEQHEVKDPEEVAQEENQTDAGAASHLAVEEPIERPKSPWTPSYSVTSQGPGIVPEEEIPEIGASEEKITEDISVVDTTASPEAVEEQEVLASSITIDEGQQAPVTVEEEVEATEPAAVTPQLNIVDETPLEGITLEDKLAQERPKSPWTPSYSVSKQGSPAPPTVEASEDQVPSVVEDGIVTAAPIDVEAPPSVLAEVADAEVAPQDVSEVQETEASETQPATETTTETPVEVSAETEVDESAVESAETAVQQTIEEPSTAEETSTVKDIAQQEEAVAAEVPVAAPKAVHHEGITLEAKLGLESPGNTLWTPSYSVERQGSPAPPLEADVAKVEKDTEAPASEPVDTKVTDEPALQSTDVVSEQTADLAQASEETEDQQAEVPVVEVSESQNESKEPGWTPSYSVSRQGSPAPPAAEEVQKEAKPEVSEAVVHSKEEPVALANETPTTVEEAKELAPEAVADLKEDPVVLANEAPVIVAPVATRHEGITLEDKLAQNEDASKSLWTPSYSVSRQGSPAPPATSKPSEPEEATVAPVESTETKEVAEAAVPETITAVEEPESKEATIEKDESTVEDTKPEVPEVEVSESPAASQEQDVPANDKAASPWAQSYSVSRQGSPQPPTAQLPETEETAPAKEVQQTEVQEVPVADLSSVKALHAEVPVASDAESKIWTPSYSVTTQGTEEEAPTSKPEETVEVTEAADVPESNTLAVDTTTAADGTPERTGSPWTPSYSVMRQGSGIVEPEGDEKELDKLEPLPAIATTTEPKEISKVDTDLTKFPASEGHEDAASLTSLDTVTKDPNSAARSRLESTTSSLMFPGGWFSKPPPGRASFDNAKGVFISKGEAPRAVESTPEEGTSVAAEAEPEPSTEGEAATDAEHETTATSTDKDKVKRRKSKGKKDKEKEKKSKWCIVM